MARLITADDDGVTAQVIKRDRKYKMHLSNTKLHTNGAGGHTQESCAGWTFLSAPAPHPQNINPPRTRRNLINLARTRPADHPNPHRTFSVLKPQLSENY